MMPVISIDANIVLLLFAVVATCFGCHSFSPHATQYQSRARARGVTSMDRQPLDVQAIDLKCADFRPYNFNELRSTASIAPFGDASRLAVADGGRVTCSFDDAHEYCSWHNAPETIVKFWKARFDHDFDVERFDCTNVRRFMFDDSFLLAGGEPVLSPQTVALETSIPCQYGSAVVKFDFWASSEGPILRQCIVRGDGGDIQCEDILPMANPVNFTVSQSMTPIRIRIEVVNVGTNDVIFIDNLLYEGQICELTWVEVADEDEEAETVTAVVEASLSSTGAASDDASLTMTTPTADSVPTAAEKFFEDEDHHSSGGVPTVSVFGIQTSKMKLRVPSTSSPPMTLTTSTTASIASVNELSPCQALTCSFNDGDSCFYGLNGIGGTTAWLLSSELVGNRHTGIQRINLLDQKQVGFVYAGSDTKSLADDLLVMESPKFSLKNDVFLVFDVYLRSFFPRLKVCVDNFDDCPYSSPALDKKIFWHTSHKLPLTVGARKVYFVASNIGRHGFIAVDNVRLENADGESICSSDDVLEPI